MTDTDQYAERLRLSNLLREPALRAAIQALKLPGGSRGLDVGCGIGLHTLLLAQAIGPTGHVTGLDLSPEFIALAGEYARKHDLAEQVSFQEGDMNHLPFEDDSFDWVWCADTLHPDPFNEPLPALREFVRVIRPGGRVALLYWSSQKLLPGYPLLEARLDAAFAEAAPYTKGVHRPEFHLMRALGWLRDAGLENLTAHTFTADVYAPLGDETRRALTMTFQMFWGWLQPSLSAEDWAKFHRLCQPESPEFILNQPDYYAFLTYSLFQGKKLR